MSTYTKAILPCINSSGLNVILKGNVKLVSTNQTNSHEWEWQCTCSLQNIWPRRPREPRLALHPVLIQSHWDRWPAVIACLWHIIFNFHFKRWFDSRLMDHLHLLNGSPHLSLKPIQLLQHPGTCVDRPCVTNGAFITIHLFTAGSRCHQD